jgi:hypothetical protein
MNEAEIESTFATGLKTTLTMDPGMSILELALKINCFKSTEDAIHKIKAGGNLTNFLLP